MPVDADASKTCLKRPFKKRQTKVLKTNDINDINEGRKYCRML